MDYKSLLPRPIISNSGINKIYLADEKDNYGMHNIYSIDLKNATYNSFEGKVEPYEHMMINFQENIDRNIPSPSHGVTELNLLDIVKHRLQCCKDNCDDYEISVALNNVEEALNHLMNTKIIK